MMMSLQKHSHSDYCQRSNKCCFGFPKAPSASTVIACKLEDDNSESIIDDAKVTLNRLKLYSQPQQPTALCKAAPLLNTCRHYFPNITIRMNRGTKLFSPCVSFRSS